MTTETSFNTQWKETYTVTNFSSAGTVTIDGKEVNVLIDGATQRPETSNAEPTSFTGAEVTFFSKGAQKVWLTFPAPIRPYEGFADLVLEVYNRNKAQVDALLSEQA